jgi:hypothetical protein
MKIKICKEFKKVKSLQKRLKKTFPNDKVIIKKCLKACEICEKTPMVRVKKKKHKAPDITSLIDKIEAKY